ncbi:MAG: transposase domain-containing protein, partial [Verrucomicrobiota bacterium]
MKRELERVRGSGLGELQGMLKEVIPPELVGRHASNGRRRRLPQEVAFWAFLSQALSEDSSCAQAVARVQSWSAAAELPVPSADTSSYCKARQRLPEEMLEAIHEHLVEGLDRSLGGDYRWRGRALKAVDGSSV